MFQDSKSDVSGVLNQRSPATDPSLFGVSGVGHSKPSLLSPGVLPDSGSQKIWPVLCTSFFFHADAEVFFFLLVLISLEKLCCFGF